MKYNTKRRKNQKAMWKLLLAVSISALAVIHFMGFSVNVIYPVSEGSRVTVAKAEIEPVSRLIERVSVEDQIRAIAEARNFKWTDYLVRLAYCESRLDPNTVNVHGNKPKESYDRGLFQINSHWHKEVTNEQAFDISWSTNWTIDMINAGKQGQWACNKIIRK